MSRHSLAKAGSPIASAMIEAAVSAARYMRGQPGVWAEQLHVEGVMLTAPEHAGPVRVPFVRVIRRPGVLDSAPDIRPIPIQPRVVAEVFPLPICFDDRAEVSVGTWTDDVEAGTERKPLAEGQAAARQLIIGELRFAERSLKRREKIGERLLIVPDVGATPLARAFAGCAGPPIPRSHHPPAG